MKQTRKTAAEIIAMIAVIVSLAGCGDGSDDSGEGSLSRSCTAELICEAIGQGNILDICDSNINDCAINGCVEVDCATLTITVE